MKKMKRNAIFFGAVVTALLMISSATAVEKVNNELVIEAIETEQTQEEMIDQLMAIWDDLVANDPTVAYYADALDINAEEDFEKLFNLEGLLDHIISDEFINMINNNLDDLLANVAYQIIYNTEPMQEYIQSDEFIQFMQTDKMQYFLSQIDTDSAESSETFQSFVQQNQEFLGTLEVGYDVSSNEPQNVGLPINGEENDGATFQVYSYDEELPTIYAALAFIGLLIGLITWIPAATLIMLCAPIVWVLVLIEILLIPGPPPWVPGMIISIAIASFIFVFGAAAIIAIGWPGLVAAIFAGVY